VPGREIADDLLEDGLVDFRQRVDLGRDVQELVG
jgi:hypothetical protein